MGEYNYAYLCTTGTSRVSRALVLSDICGHGRNSPRFEEVVFLSFNQVIKKIFSIPLNL